MIDLRGKRAWVCGGSQGIGKGCALALARCGAGVTLVARHEEALRQAQSDLDISAGQRHGYVAHDFAKPAGLAEKVERDIAAHGPVHILVNNTGGPPGGPILDARPEAFEAAFAAHVVCNQLLVQGVVPGMKTASYGRIINIISMSVKTPIPGLGVSNTIRGAVASWAKTLAGELAASGVTVNNILPGYIDTARLHSLIEKRAAEANMSIEQMSREFLKQVPAGRFGTTQEIGNVVAFLASPAAAYVTGINVPVDGGRTPAL
jgi:3-oxoacyl-[acyl-carrier protein] reductase